MSKSLALPLLLPSALPAEDTPVITYSPLDGSYLGSDVIGRYAIDSIILPPPDVAALPTTSRTHLLFAENIVLSLSQLDVTAVNYLARYIVQAPAKLAIRLKFGWIVDIPVLLRSAFGTTPGSTTLYLTTLEDVLLVTPRYPAQFY